ncbi:hypothetical protein BDV19DRAFT_356357 [Aspergillus venezuelensis]
MDPLPPPTPLLSPPASPSTPFSSFLTSPSTPSCPFSLSLLLFYSSSSQTCQLQRQLASHVPGKQQTPCSEPPCRY